MKKFTEVEDFKHSNEEIEDFFWEFVDSRKFKLIDGYIRPSDNRFFTETAAVSPKDRRAKHIVVDIDKMANGIQTYQDGKCLTSFDSLLSAINIAKKFFQRTGYDINYQILQNFDDVEVHIYLVGGLVTTSQLDTKNEINTSLSELQGYLKEYKFKRVSLQTNFLDIRTPVKDRDLDTWLFRTLRNAGNLNADVYNEESKTRKLFNNLNAWANKVNPNYEIVLSGGDNQVVVKLKKR